MRTKLQLAIDTLAPGEAVALVEKIHPFIDLIEIGTPFIKHYGLHMLELFQPFRPSKLLVADMKTMDAGTYEAAIAFEAGADMMTVLGCADDETIRGAVQEANRRGHSVAADLIAIPNKLERAQQLERLGVHYIGIHSGLDQQVSGASPLTDFQQVRVAVSTPLMIAGGINMQKLGAIAVLEPAIVVVGSAITQASDPVAACSALYKALKKIVVHS